MKLEDTKVLMGGMLRCCLDTIQSLPDGEYQDSFVIDCKHEPKGNQSIVLRDGVWQWNAPSRESVENKDAAK